MAGHQSQPKLNYNQIFRRASNTHFFGSLFFSTTQRKAVTQLYVFCRAADDLADEPVSVVEFASLSDMQDQWKAARAGQYSNHQLINDFILLQETYGIPDALPEYLFAALKKDAEPEVFADIAALEEYMFGVAGVVGVMLCYILGLPESAHESAKNLGYAAQMINILRDVDKDLKIGRVYIPVSDLKSAGLNSLHESDVKALPLEFAALMEFELARFTDYISKAEEGFSFLSYRQRVAIWTIVDLYNWTALQINHDPMVVYRKQIKPSWSYALSIGIRNLVKEAISTLIRK